MKTVLLKKSRKMIEQCAKLSKDAYTHDEDIEHIEDKYTDCMIYFKRENDILYIYGPGSISLRDWSLDFQIWRVTVSYFDNAYVHAGFMRIYNAIRSRVQSKVKEYIDNGITKIVCTGHSLFGAIASITALDVAHNMEHELPVSCVTFGSPRVGNSRFTSVYNNCIFESFRCVYKKDPVTFTPLPLRFKHVRGLIHHNGEIMDRKFYKFNFCGCEISDHSMKTYCEAFKE
jgi:hypothetical protein